MIDVVEPAGPGAVSRPATAASRRICVTLVALLVLVSVAASWSVRLAFPPLLAFIPAFAATTALADALTAVLLLRLYRVGGSPALLAAGAAYALNALLIVPYALTFPGVIDARGFIGNEQSAATLWLVWHLTFPIVTAAGALLPRRLPRPQQRRAANAIAAVTVGAVAVTTTLAVTAGRDQLPVLVRHGAFSALWPVATSTVGALTAAAIIVLLRRGRPLTTLHLWLIVALASAACDIGLNFIAPVRYSLPWYVGKSETFVSASIVLIALLGEWSELQARLVALDRDLVRTRADGRALREQFAREHAIAATLQQALLPARLPDIAGVVLSTAYRPAVTGLEIGGDWYDAFMLSDGRLAVTIGDVAGHGLAASIVMGKMRQSLRLAAAMVPHPAAMLAAADGALRVEHPDMMVTAFVGLLEPRTGVLHWASAGHPPAMIRRPDGRIEELGGQAPPLGIYDVAAPCFATSLEPASFFVAYTDGLIEFAHDVLSGLAKVRAAITAPELAARSDAAAALFDSVVGESARDDVAVLTISMRERIEAPQSSDRVLTST